MRAGCSSSAVDQVARRRRARRCSARSAAAAATARSATVHAPALEGLYGRTGAAGRRQRRSRPTTQYIRDSILLPQAQIAAGYPRIMPTYQNVLGRGRGAEARRLHQVAGDRSGRRRQAMTDAARRRTPRSRAIRRPRPDRKPPSERRQLSARRPHAALLAAHHRPQAHRHALSDLGHVLLLRRRRRRGADAHRTADARTATS